MVVITTHTPFIFFVGKESLLALVAQMFSIKGGDDYNYVAGSVAQESAISRPVTAPNFSVKDNMTLKQQENAEKQSVIIDQASRKMEKETVGYMASVFSTK